MPRVWAFLASQGLQSRRCARQSVQSSREPIRSCPYDHFHGFYRKIPSCLIRLWLTWGTTQYKRRLGPCRFSRLLEAGWCTECNSWLGQYHSARYQGNPQSRSRSHRFPGFRKFSLASSEVSGIPKEQPLAKMRRIQASLGREMIEYPTISEIQVCRVGGPFTINLWITWSFSQPAPGCNKMTFLNNVPPLMAWPLTSDPWH